MNGYSDFKNKLRHRSEIIEEIIQGLETSSLAGEADTAKWRSYLSGVHESLQEPFLKVAVVGSVKSGKSTLINAMIGSDLLKRGAGIITSFITRVIADGEPGGWVELKSWTQIVSEINSSVRMLPIFAERKSEQKELDIRTQEDQTYIAYWLGKMKSEWLQGRGNIDPHFMFLERCLEGFGLVESEIGNEVSRTTFDKKDISKHQLYAGEECRSVYVRDIELHYPIPWLGEQIELADCQGSDSPNPVHFELLQQYLLSSHFIIYVIGSRTGLREADFKLLDLIKGLKMFPQTLFVLNLDLNAHNDKDDLERISGRVASELGWVVPEPRLFAFSALFQLLKQLGDKSPKFEHRHFKIWKETKILTKTSEAGWNLFTAELKNRVSLQRSEVLFGCGLSRLGMIAANVNDTVRACQAALKTSSTGMSDIAEKLRSRHTTLQASLQNLADTVSGLNRSIKSELNPRIDHLFDPSRGTIVREALNLIDNYPVELNNRQDISDYAGLVRHFYGFFLEFRSNLSRHLIERVNLRIMEFAKREESLLKERITKSSESLWAFFDASLADYRQELLGMIGQGSLGTKDHFVSVGDPTVKIIPPCFSSFLERTTLGRGILFLKFGLTSLPAVLSGIKAQIRKKAEPAPEQELSETLFKEAQEKARSEARSEVLRAFHNFSENLKSGYLYRIVDDGCVFLLDEFRTRAEMAQVDFTNLLKQNRIADDKRKSAIETLSHAQQITTSMIEELEELRKEAETLPDQAVTAEEGL